MPDKSWGTGLTVNQKVVVGQNEEIPTGQFAWVLNASTLEYDTIWDRDWEAFLAGDITKLKNDLESKIPNTKVQWLRFYWDKTEKSDPFYSIPDGRWKFAYHVYGFKIEAIVKNTGGASLTGLEIIVILLIAFVVIPLVALGVWVCIKIMNAAEQLGPVATIGVGLAVLFFIFILLLVLFGGSMQYQGKKRRFKIGR